MIRPLILSATLLALVGCKSREEKLAAEESKGNFVVSAQSRLLKGMGEALKTEGTEAAGSLSEGTGQVVKAVGGGFEKSLGQVKLSVNEGLQASGVAATRAALASRDEEQQNVHGVSVYLIFEKAYTGPLELRAYDAQGAEIGRSRMEFNEAEPTARYVDFVFDRRTPLLTAGSFGLR